MSMTPEATVTRSLPSPPRVSGRPVSQNINVEDQFSLTGSILSTNETATTGDIPFADAG